MSIFNSISEELSYELSFIEDTNKDYDTYLTVSNESIKLNVYLYDSIGLEDFKDTIKKGAKYIWSLLVKAFIGASNIWRRFIHFITMSKSILVLKSVDEELKTYEVAHPEIVDENKAFWDGIDFDSMPVATEDVNDGPFESHLSNTALYRILLLAAVIQPSNDFQKDIFGFN